MQAIPARTQWVVVSAGIAAPHVAIVVARGGSGGAAVGGGGLRGGRARGADARTGGRRPKQTVAQHGRGGAGERGVEGGEEQGAAVARQAAAIPVWESKSTLFWEGDSR